MTPVLSTIRRTLPLSQIEPLPILPFLAPRLCSHTTWDLLPYGKPVTHRRRVHSTSIQQVLIVGQLPKNHRHGLQDYSYHKSGAIKGSKLLRHHDDHHPHEIQLPSDKMNGDSAGNIVKHEDCSPRNSGQESTDGNSPYSSKREPISQRLCLQDDPGKDLKKEVQKIHKTMSNHGKGLESGLEIPPREPLSNSSEPGVITVHLKSLNTGAIEQLDSAWLCRFSRTKDAIINRTKGKRYLRKILPDDSKEGGSVKNILTKAEAKDIQQWLADDPTPWNEQRRKWVNMLLWTLHENPGNALKVLQAMCLPRRFLPTYIISDVVEYITEFYLKDMKVPHKRMVGRIIKAIETLVRDRPARAARPEFSQHTIFLLLKNADDSQIRSLFETLLRCQVYLHPNTQLQFAYRFAKFGLWSDATRCFTDLGTEGFDVPKPNLLKVCAVLLQNPHLTHDDKFRLLENMKIPANLILFTIILRQTLSIDDIESAWKVFRTIHNTDLQLNDYVYSTLINGLKSRKDIESIDALVAEAEKNGIMSRSVHLITDLLHSIYLVGHTKRNFNVFRAMLSTYEMYFNTQALIDLLLPVYARNPSARKLEPSGQTIRLMLIAYIRRCRDPRLLQSLYVRYHELVSKGPPYDKMLAEDPYVPDAFCLAFGRHPSTVGQCTTVIKDMLKWHSSTSFEPARPSVRTWTTVMAAFFRHGQKNAGEKVLQIMRSHNIEPTMRTWNALVTGYVVNKDTRGIVDALKRMQNAGWELGGSTTALLSRLPEREQVLEALRDSSVQSDPGSLDVESYLTSTDPSSR